MFQHDLNPPHAKWKLQWFMYREKHSYQYRFRVGSSYPTHNNIPYLFHYFSTKKLGFFFFLVQIGIFFLFFNKIPKFWYEKRGHYTISKSLPSFSIFFPWFPLGILQVLVGYHRNCFFNKNNGGFFPMLGNYQVWSVRIVWLILVSKNWTETGFDIWNRVKTRSAAATRTKLSLDSRTGTKSRNSWKYFFWGKKVSDYQKKFTSSCVWSPLGLHFFEIPKRVTLITSSEPSVFQSVQNEKTSEGYFGGIEKGGGVREGKGQN